MLKKKGKFRQRFDFGGIHFISLYPQTLYNMRGVLHYIWKNRLLPKKGLQTTEGKSIRIISCGGEGEKENIFYNARIAIDDKEWCGDVIIHHRSSDWEKEERHSSDTNTNIILHVTAENNCEKLRRHGEAITQLCLRVPDDLEQEFECAQQHSGCMSCSNMLERMKDVEINGYLSRLLIERIEEKAENIQKTFSECKGRWDETLFKTIVRSYGFGIQSDQFEKLAKILDMNALGKHRNNLLQVEAIMFGQAGLLEEESIPHYYRAEALRSEYYREVLQEYRFLKNKFNLKSLDYKEWGNGNAAPHVRIARIAALFCQKQVSISSILSCNTIEEYRSMIDCTLVGYWQNHTCLGSTATVGNGSMRANQMDIIIINAIIPLLYIYGKHRNDCNACCKAEELLHNLRSEENSIIRKWKERGLEIKCAADSQAVLQLERRYCRMQNCAACRFAYYYIKERMAEEQ